jgi:hypothetical protein
MPRHPTPHKPECGPIFSPAFPTRDQAVNWLNDPRNHCKSPCVNGGGVIQSFTHFRDVVPDFGEEEQTAWFAIRFCVSPQRRD